MGVVCRLFNPSLILHFLFVSMYLYLYLYLNLYLFPCFPPHPILVVLTGGWKEEEPDETFGDKLLVGRSLPDFYILFGPWHLQFSISERNMEICGLCLQNLIFWGIFKFACIQFFLYWDIQSPGWSNEEL